jgi:hypothetical protein
MTFFSLTMSHNSSEIIDEKRILDTDPKLPTHIHLSTRLKNEKSSSTGD